MLLIFCEYLLFMEDTKLHVLNYIFNAYNFVRDGYKGRCASTNSLFYYHILLKKLFKFSMLIYILEKLY